MHTREEKLEAFGRLLDIMDDLREKCPWDKKQTMESLRVLTIEETHELADAIIDNNLEEIKNELGDILLHMVFYSKIGEEQEAFDVADVLHGISEKLIRRHPHIYGDTKVANEQDVKENWEQIKLKEKANKGVLSGVPNSIPSLIQAIRIQEKAAGVGFDWDNKEQVYEKYQEEWQELQEEVKQENAKKIEEEFGDVLFSLINYARFLDVNPDNALAKTNTKFINRFKFIETQAKEQGQRIHDLSIEEMNRFWEIAKEK
ncbi:MAG TPA: nucleoside triphosphate pyrophosphohydrolase [Flavobacteriaceae bacterium]|nr:nucleoside triphosphate pyrophosphohydrolase [Flavobacteriaceae bacterium]